MFCESFGGNVLWWGYFVLAGMELGSDFKEDRGGKSQPSAVSVIAVIDIVRLLEKQGMRKVCVWSLPEHVRLQQKVS